MGGLRFVAVINGSIFRGECPRKFPANFRWECSRKLFVYMIIMGLYKCVNVE